MYGWINECIEHFFLHLYGIEVWEKVKSEAGMVLADGCWKAKMHYPDGSTYAIIEAGARVTNMSEDEMYVAYGSFFIDFVSDRGYHNILRCLGGSLRDWMSRVNLLHSHLEFQLPDIVAPDFWCLNDAENAASSVDSFVLCYRSYRGAFLAPLVVGMMTRAASRFFNSHIRMEQKAIQNLDAASYTSWKVIFSGAVDPSLPAPPLNAIQGGKVTPQAELDALKALCPHLNETTTNAKRERAVSFEGSPHKCERCKHPLVVPFRKSPLTSDKYTLPVAPNADFDVKSTSESPMYHKSTDMSSGVRIQSADTKIGVGMSAAQVQHLFPFHIAFDDSLNIVQLGKYVKNFVSTITEGRKMTEYFEMNTPPFSWCWSSLIPLAETSDIGIKVNRKFASKDSAILSLAGPISFSDDRRLAFLLCSPDVKSFAEMAELSMSLDHLVGQNLRVEALLQHENMLSTREENEALQHLTKMLEEERASSFKLMQEVTNATQEALAVKKTFVRYVSHEIRTPLSVLQLGITLLEHQVKSLRNDQSLVDDALETIDNCRGSVDLAVSVLGDLLSYENLESGVIMLHKQPVHLLPFVAAAIEPYRLQGQEKEVEIMIQATSKILASLYLSVDPAKMSQAVRNLVSNSIQCSVPGSTVNIDITWEPPGSKLQRNNAGHSFHSSNESRGSGTHSEVTFQSDLMSSIISNLKTMRDYEERLQPGVFMKCDTDNEILDKFEQYGYVIIVLDTRVGISLEQEDLILRGIDKFNPEKLTAVGRSGLGLWISHGIVELHGGVLAVTSQGEEKGSCFTIRLPSYRLKKNTDLTDAELSVIHKAVAASRHKSTRLAINSKSNYGSADSCDEGDNIFDNTTKVDQKNEDSFEDVAKIDIERETQLSQCGEEAISDATSIFKNKRCLIVDDAHLIRKLMVRALVGRGCVCVDVEDGADAVKCVEECIGTENEFDIILMDFVMPHMDGPTATSAIRLLGCNCPILGVTGNVLPEDVHHFMSKGADAVFGKPISFTDLEDYLMALQK